MKQYCGCYLLLWPIYYLGTIYVDMYYIGVSAVLATISGTGLWLILIGGKK